MTFFVERFNGGCWTCLMAAQHYVNPHAISGPPECPYDGVTAGGLFPPARTPGNASAFAGKPGWQARVRFDDQVLEVYDWARVLADPGDDNSALIWGWQLMERHHVALPNDRIAVGEFSVL